MIRFKVRQMEGESYKETRDTRVIKSEKGAHLGAQGEVRL